MEKEVFISYSSRDQQIADELISVIEQAGVSCWIAHRDIVPGADWADSINKALENCKIFVLIFSKNSSVSVQVSKEITLAVSNNKVVIPYKIDETMFEGKMAYYLCDTHWLDANKYFGNEGMTALSNLVVKILNSGEATDFRPATPTAHTQPDTAPLLKRVFMFLEDGEWTSAEKYCEKVLDIDPENAMAYLGKLLAELRLRKQEDLKDCPKLFDRSNNYHKVIRFCDDGLKEELRGYLEYINTQNELARIESIYCGAKNSLAAAKNEDECKAAAKVFESIADYKDSTALVQECYDKIKDLILDSGKDKMAYNSIVKYNVAISIFESIPGWKDADECAELCRQKINEITAQKEAVRAERERLAEISRQNARRDAKVKAIVIASVCAIIALIVLFVTIILPGIEYKKAQNQLRDKYENAEVLMEEGKFHEAYKLLKELGDYKDSRDRRNEVYALERESMYKEAVAFMDDGKADEALEIFDEISNYKDSYSRAESLRLSNRLNRTKDKLKNVSAGDHITFGGEESTDALEWTVLDVKNGKALLITKYSVANKKYNELNTKVTWETSSLRAWLNNDFIASYFSEEEAAMISTENVFVDNNSEYPVDSGNATYDKAFLLSITEVNKYFNSDSARICKNDKDATLGCSWWVRTLSGFGGNSAAFIYYDGSLGMKGRSVDQPDVAVRPAMWVEIES